MNNRGARAGRRAREWAREKRWSASERRKNAPYVQCYIINASKSRFFFRMRIGTVRPDLSVKGMRERNRTEMSCRPRTIYEMTDGSGMARRTRNRARALLVVLFAH